MAAETSADPCYPGTTFLKLESSRLYQYSLILIHPGEGYREDFLEISRLVQQFAPEILVVSVDHTFNAPLPEVVWSQPVLLVSITRPVRLKPKCGRIYGSRHILKDAQATIFERAQLPTPKTELFEFGKRLSESDWGPFVVLKPMMINSSGLGIHLVRTSRVHKLKIANFPSDHLVHQDTYLVQSFIDTGNHPSQYRVLTFLGEPLLCKRNSRLAPRPDLSCDDKALFNSEIASNGGLEPNSWTTELFYDVQIIEFAKKMHAAAPGIAVMGCDILKDASTGKLYALEMNAGGNAWTFSSKLGETTRKIIGKQKMIDQFGAWDVAARILVQKTRQEAAVDGVHVLYRSFV